MKKGIETEWRWSCVIFNQMPNFSDSLGLGVTNSRVSWVQSRGSWVPGRG